MDKDTLEKIGNRCKRLRANWNPNKKTSQRELAKILDIPHSRISLIETGQAEMTMNELQAYKREFKQCSYDYLLGNAQYKDPKIEKISEMTRLSERALNRLSEFQDYIIAGLNTLLQSQYAINILSAIYSASEIRNYSGEDLFKFNNIRTKHIQKACEEALLQEDLANIARSVDILAELEYSPKKQAEFMAQKYFTLLFDEISNGGEQDGEHTGTQE